MGTHKFKLLSNIIPNVWFYKLKSIKTNTISEQASNEAEAISVPTSTTPLQVTISHSRKSHHIKSPKKRRPASSAACSCATSAVHSVLSKSTTTTSSSSSSIDSLSLPPEARCFDRMIALSSTSCNCSSNSLLPDSEDDVVNGVDKLSLAPIKTEHKKFSDLVSEIGPRKQRRRISASSSGSSRVRIRANSPRLSKRVGSHGRRRKSAESMAVVKTSADPERDFRDSMVEMIVENEIRAVKDLEELLACYLSLNSVEYHHLIVEVFKQIWFDFNGIH